MLTRRIYIVVLIISLFTYQVQAMQQRQRNQCVSTTVFFTALTTVIVGGITCANIPESRYPIQSRALPQGDPRELRLAPSSSRVARPSCSVRDYAPTKMSVTHVGNDHLEAGRRRTHGQSRQNYGAVESSDEAEQLVISRPANDFLIRAREQLKKIMALNESVSMRWEKLTAFYESLKSEINNFLQSKQISKHMQRSLIKLERSYQRVANIRRSMHNNIDQYNAAIHRCLVHIAALGERIGDADLDKAEKPDRVYVIHRGSRKGANDELAAQLAELYCDCDYLNSDYDDEEATDEIESQRDADVECREALEATRGARNYFSGIDLASIKEFVPKSLRAKAQAESGQKFQYCNGCQAYASIEHGAHDGDVFFCYHCAYVRGF